MSGDSLSRGLPAQELPENQDESVQFHDIGHQRFAVDKNGELGDEVEVERNFTGATPNPEPVELEVTEFEEQARPDMPHIDTPLDVDPVNQPAGNAPEPDWTPDGPAEGQEVPVEEETPASAPEEPADDEAQTESEPEEEADEPKSRPKPGPKPKGTRK